MSRVETGIVLKSIEANHKTLKSESARFKTISENKFETYDKALRLISKQIDNVEGELTDQELATRAQIQQLEDVTPFPELWKLR